MYSDSSELNQAGRWTKVAFWEHLLFAFILIVSLLYAVPSFFSSAPSLQISPNTADKNLDQAFVRRTERLLQSQQIGYDSIELVQATNGRDRVEVTFVNAQNQLKARALVTEALGREYVTALNNKRRIPQWLSSIGGSSIRLGLDLQGGVHFLLQVDTQEALNQRLESLESEVRDLLSQEAVQFVSIERQSTLPDQDYQNSLSVTFPSAQVDSKIQDMLEERLGQIYQIDQGNEDGKATISLSMSITNIREIESAAVEQNIISLRNRVNELGVAEPVVQRQGSNRIVVELPGVQDTTQAKRVIGATANLEFRMEATDSEPLENVIRLAFRDQSQQRARLERNVIVTGANVIDAQAGFDENGRPQVNIELDSTGGSVMADVTRSAIGRRMGAVFIEYKNKQETNAEGEVTGTSRFIEKSIISLATVESAFANRFRITGLRNQNESAELALLLRAGSLAAPVYFVEELTIGASLGEENIRLGSISMLVGVLLVALFMLYAYRGCGAITIFAVLVNTALVVSALSLLSATLTLPGIAGLVLTLGMIVDANILIYSRIRSEIQSGFYPPAALANGFSRAFVTILDANITTLLVAIILFAIGTGPVRGFAITLSLGIIGSLLTCVFMVRYFLKLSFNKRNKISSLLLQVS